MRIMKQDYGAVMMETILSLPVYIIMLAGIFWLGELAMARLALVSGENFALWQISNRHDGNTIPDFFSFMSNMNSSQEEVITRAAMQQNQFSTTDNAAANSWGKVIHGHSTISTRRSDWSAGADQSAQSMNSTDRNSISTDNGSRVVFPRDSVSEGNIPDVKLFSRASGTANRNGYYKNNTRDNGTGHIIYNSKWENSIGPQKSKTWSNLERYTRNGDYLDWSE